MVKTVLLNVLVLLALLAVLLLAPPVVYDLYRHAEPFAAWRPSDPRATLPNYRGIEWAAVHFEEFARMRTRYHDFIGWRRMPFQGRTITIDGDGYRRHPSGVAREDAAIWVFGGSTIWGPGVDDASTIPARLQARSGRTSFNFGESGYTAHQSYNLLIKNYLLGGRPRHVVFYDGANEVVNKCRAELGFFSAAQEQVIRARLASESMTWDAVAPAIDVLGRMIRRLWSAPPEAAAGGYDCHVNEAKRRLIAANLVLDWQLARQLVESRGGTFLPVLQPVAFVGTPNLSHLPAVRGDAPLRAQYDALYPEIVRQLDAAGIRYLDLTRSFDGDELLYIDFVHVAPRGNDRIAQQIAARLN